MRKIYIFLFVASLVSKVVGGEYGKVKSFSLYDLTSTSLNKSYTDSQGNSIKVSTLEPKFNNEATLVYSATIDNPLYCIDEVPSVSPVGAKYSSAIMVGHATAKVVESPQVLIEIAGDDKILEIEILALATSGGANESIQADLICAFSSGDDPNNDDDFMINLEYEDPLLAFNQTKCASENKRKLPVGTKFIKLIAADFFGFTGISSYACKPQIHAINIYAKDTGTSIGETASDILDIQLHGRNLQLSEMADVVVYDIAGKVVAKFRKVDNAYLNFVNGGVYVIQAMNENGEKVIRKVVIE